MKILKVAAVLALVAIPFLLASRKKEEMGTLPEQGDDNSIFDGELSAD